MTAHPIQLLTLVLLGLIAAFVLVGALYLLYRVRRRPVVVGGTPPADWRSHPIVAPRGRRQAMKVAIPLAMVLWVFAGKYLVAPFFPSGERPTLPASTATTLRGASGADLAVSHYGPENGPVLVFTHGWGADQRDWAWLIDDLPKQFHVVLWDLPGLGKSTAPRGQAYAMSTLAADLDSVVASLNGRPAILVGHSVGGMLNLEYARRYPQKLGKEVRGLVQANTTYTNPIATKKNAERSLKLQKPVLEPLMHVVSGASPVFRALGWLAYQSGLAHMQLALQSFAGGETWDQLDEMARFAYRSSPAVVAKGVLAMGNWDGTDVLQKINVPTLVVAGAQDVTTLPAASDHMERNIPSAVRESVSPAAHMGPVEQHRRYAQLIGSFVMASNRQHLAGPPIADPTK
jgi:pimeloyl-ACP methyl ester carboxylesterase